MAYTKYSLTPANNNAAPPDGAPEGMLPSAVNDTMRDMMAQIRDVGDGIRGGTYTMTAPVITGGSINGTTVGAGTASTGAFTTLGATGVATFSAGTVSAPAITTTGDTNTGIYFPAADTIAFTEGGAESMRIDSSGNVGIGSTSISGWNGKTLQIASTTNDAGIKITGDLGSWGIGGCGTASGSNALRFYNFTSSAEAMRIDSSANVGIGTSSPGAKLDITNNQAALSYLIDTNNTTNGGSSIWRMITRNIANTGTTSVEFYKPTGSGFSIINNDTNASNFTAFNVGSSERMRIDSSGNVAIGMTPSTDTLLEVYGSAAATCYKNSNTGTGTSDGFYVGCGKSSSTDAYVYNRESAPVIFGTANAERMRIDSSGDVFIGTTANIGSGYKAVVSSGGNGIGITTAGGNGTQFCGFFYTSTSIGSISNNSNTGVLYNVTSDYRLKTVIAPVTDAGERIDALQPIEYDWNTGGKAKGFLAHQFAEIYPNSVTGEKDAVDAEGKPVYQSMQASSTEVMADLIAEIQSLRKRVAQLESK
jgi:hypothetical protein